MARTLLSETSRICQVANVVVLLVLAFGCAQTDPENDGGQSVSEDADSSTRDGAENCTATDACVEQGAPAIPAQDSRAIDELPCAIDGSTADASQNADAASATDAAVPGEDSDEAGTATDASTFDDAAAPALEGWFVDSVAGSDDNDGRSEATPFATLAKVRQSPIQTGDVIHLARGSLWREELIDLPQGIIVRAYGAGPRPLIDGSDPADNARFQKTPDLTNVYEIAWSHAFGSDGGKSAHRVWEDGVRLRRVLDLATCDATPGSFYAAPPTNGGPDTVYVHASDSTDLSANGHLYELTARRSAIQLYSYKDHASVYSIHTRRNAYADGSLVVDGLISDCLAEDGRVHNVFIRGTCEDTTAWKTEPPSQFGGATMFVSYTDQRDEATVVYRRCKAIGEQATGPTGGSNGTLTVGFYGHGFGKQFGTAVYEECDATGVGMAYGFLDVKDTLYYNCSSTVGSIVMGGNPRGTLAVLGGSHRTLVNGGTLFKENADYGMPEKVLIRGVRMVQDGGYNNPIWLNRAATYLELSRSTFVMVNGGIMWLEKGSFSIKNNIFAGNNAITRVHSTDVTYVSDQNVYFNTNPDTPDALLFQIDLGPTLFGLTNWHMTTGQDTGSIFTDPLFIGDPRMGDFRVAVDSPAWTLEAGADYETEENDTVLQSYRESIMSSAGL